MFDSNAQPDRKSVRMKQYNSSQSGFYLVTICVAKRRCVFGEICDDTVHLNAAGLIAQSMWKSLPRRFSVVRLDSFVIMLNHLHGIIELRETNEIPPDVADTTVPAPPARFQAPMGDKALIRANPPLGQIVRTFKGATTYEIHRVDQPDFAWQSGYHESVLRNEKALEYAQHYIINNPVTWLKDSLRV